MYPNFSATKVSDVLFRENDYHSSLLGTRWNVKNYWIVLSEGRNTNWPGHVIDINTNQQHTLERRAARFLALFATMDGWVSALSRNCCLKWVWRRVKLWPPNWLLGDVAGKQCISTRSKEIYPAREECEKTVHMKYDLSNRLLRTTTAQVAPHNRVKKVHFPSRRRHSSNAFSNRLRGCGHQNQLQWQINWYRKTLASAEYQSVTHSPTHGVLTAVDEIPYAYKTPIEQCIIKNAEKQLCSSSLGDI